MNRSRRVSRLTLYPQKMATEGPLEGMRGMRYQRQAPRRVDPVHPNSEAGGYPMGHAGLSPRLSPIMENLKHLAQERGLFLQSFRTAKTSPLA